VPSVPGPARETGQAAFLSDLGAPPNLVSLARIALVYVGIALWYEGLRRVALAVGLAAGLSDYLDGYLARRLKRSTRIGALLDQAADVLVVTGTIFVFVHDGSWPAFLLYVVILRETVVLNLRASAAQMGFSLPSSFLGKWASNWIFYSLGAMVLARGGFVPDPYATWSRWVGHFGITVGVVSSLVTAGQYLKSYVRQYRA